MDNAFGLTASVHENAWKEGVNQGSNLGSTEWKAMNPIDNVGLS